jgi:hypothetical protein
MTNEAKKTAHPQGPSATVSTALLGLENVSF